LKRALALLRYAARSCPSNLATSVSRRSSIADAASSDGLRDASQIFVGNHAT